MASGYSYRISSVTALSGFLFGFDTAIINGAIVFLRREFNWTEIETEVAAGSLLAGCALGAGIAGSLSDRFGRKAILLLAAVIFALSSVATALPRGLTEFILARVVAGIAIGIASLLAPLYIAEVSPATIRGRLVSLNQLAIVLGILVSYLVGWALDGQWRMMFAVAAIPSLLLFGALFFVPESPRWLAKEGRRDEAGRVLNRLGEPASQLKAIEDAIAEESGSLRQLLERAMRRPMLIGITLAVLQQVTGINTVLYYGSIIFTEQAGAASTSAALWANVIIGAMNLVFTFVALFTIDKLGRRVLLIAAAAGMGVSLTVLGLVFHSGAATPGSVLGLILCYVACFSFGMGPTVWVVISEMFPTRIRGRAMAVATVALWLACLLITVTFLSLVKTLTAAGAFWVYAALCAFTVWFVWKHTPETKGKNLEDIEREWSR